MPEKTTIMLIQTWWVAKLKTNAVLLADVKDFVFGLKAAKNAQHPCAMLKFYQGHNALTANGNILQTQDTYESLIIAPDLAYSQIDYLAAEMKKTLHKGAYYTTVDGGNIIACIETSQSNRESTDDDIEWVYRGGIYYIPARLA